MGARSRGEGREPPKPELQNMTRQPGAFALRSVLFSDRLLWEKSSPPAGSFGGAVCTLHVVRGEGLHCGAQVRGEGADLAGMDEVQIVEAFFDLERRLEATVAAARLPTASPQVQPHPSAILGCPLCAFPVNLACHCGGKNVSTVLHICTLQVLRGSLTRALLAAGGGEGDSAAARAGSCV